jgi:hypothetical protein
MAACGRLSAAAQADREVRVIGVRNTWFLFAALLLACAAQVSAQQRLYKCVDAQGKVYYTQLPPRECLGKESQELSRQGRVIREIEGALTPEQLEARDAERRKKIEDEQLAREERRRNQALLSTYSSEKDIEEARRRALKQAEEAIKDGEKKIAAAEKRRTQLETEKEFYLKTTPPPKLRDDIKTNELELRNQTALLEAKKTEISAINAKYDEDRRRYLDLTRGKGAGSAASRK